MKEQKRMIYTQMYGKIREKDLYLAQMKKLYFTLLTAALLQGAQAQELFPVAEPASTMPKGVLGVRMSSEFFYEAGQPRNQISARLSYGLLKNLTIYAQPSISNHHGEKLPGDLVNHTHNGSSTQYFSTGKVFGREYPYLFGGVYFYSKYRFFSRDDAHKHFRMALYGEYAIGKTAHDEAEVRLAGDNSGYGGGLIITQLVNRLAVSFTSGVQVADKYTEFNTLQNSQLINTLDVLYGKALSYNLSIGYLLYPRQLKDYTQNNYNIYLELMGRSYEGVTILQDGASIDIQSNALKGGNYVEAYLGLQNIINSNTRVDFSVGLNLINRSYTHYFYPVFMLSWQRYFYR
jgi:hypothetical protein